MTMNLSREGYINTEEASAYLGVSVATLRVWLKKEIIPAHRIGKLWKFKREELDMWISSGKSATAFNSTKEIGE